MLSLKYGELPAAAWDWITFNTRSDGIFSFDGFNEAAVIRTDAVPVEGYPIVCTHPMKSACQGTMFFPSVPVEGGMLGFAYESAPALQARQLGLGETVSERGYVSFSEGYPRTIFSARLDSGYIIIMDNSAEAMLRGVHISTVVIHAEQPQLALRPMGKIDRNLCELCSEPRSECSCANRGRLTTGACKCYWQAIENGPADEAIGVEHLRIWRRYLQFQRQLIGQGIMLCDMSTTADAKLLGCNDFVLKAPIRFTFEDSGPMIDAYRWEFMLRMTSQWAPVKALNVSPSADRKASWGSTPPPWEGGSVPTCDICGATFSRKFEIQRHKKTVHERVKEFVCSFCGRAFSLRHHLVSHLKCVHEKRRDYTCEHCGMCFSTQSKVNRHVKAVHLREKAYHCDDCGLEFSQRSDLNRHCDRADHHAAPDPSDSPLLSP